jgi:hypothetical protein
MAFTLRLSFLIGRPVAQSSAAGRAGSKLLIAFI